MNRDVERANEALARGRADEASVYAWNALSLLGPDDAPELARIARKLDDPRLLHEIESAGFSTVPSESAEPERVERTPIRGFARSLLGLVFALILAAAIVASIPTEPGERHPAAKNTAPQARFTRPLLAKSSGVWLVPVGEAKSVDVNRIAYELSLRYRLPVAVLRGIALPRWTIDERQRSVVAEQLILLLRQAYSAVGHAVVIGITDYDMYARTKNLLHTFAWRAPPHYGLVSTSPLAASVFDRLRGHSRHERTRKLVARNIGFLYFRRRQVDDAHSLLRGQMHGVHDIDALDEAL